ncbi:hypothetical protein K491DRAFT_599979 [Lophiostoma macrostomum CBS 122681]|uniref:DNA repair protein Rad26 n=1 Tax=Lophiostoma macrostomum CBS 122681 TaxID=1314788 RepID=A0A6A6T8H7_9PLEO|nr:hypothetical protein K491DRAFT_599979 [Lophiostoma macrostomum CBS 122681]
MDNDDDFDFSDDGLDDLPANTLQQLETTAIQATQHPPRHGAPASDYGLDDGDEVINLDEQSILPRAEPWPPVAQHAYNDAMEVEEQPQRSQADVSQLLLRIKKLEQEKARMSRDLQSEKSRFMSKSGEAETARRRLDATNRENERRMLALQQSHHEAVAKHDAELEKIRREREQAQTNNMFLEHDLAREADKTKRMKKNARNNVPSMQKQNSVPSPIGTPKRQQKNLPFRDGFDDDDILMASPTKNRDKSKAATPKQASKRKRQVVDQSPVPALQLSEPRAPPLREESSVAADKFDPSLFERLRREDHRFDLLHRLVNNRSSRGTDRVLEALTRFALPSQPQMKLSSRVYDELITCSLEQDAHTLALKFCHIFLDLWEQCLIERYYDPVYLFLDALQFILAYEPCSTAAALTEQAVAVIVRSVDLVSIPIARADMNEKAIPDLYSPTQRKISSGIDALDCLDLLYLIACSCVPTPDAIARFWQCIPTDFVLVLLKKAQPLAWITITLRILSTSALSNIIGSIVADGSAPDQQQKRETDLIDRLTRLLFDVPKTIPDPNAESSASSPSSSPTTNVLESYSTTQILNLRLQVLDLLTTFSVSPYGCSRLANLRYCIGRLVKFLDAQLNALYTSSACFPSSTSPSIPSPSSSPSPHAQTISSINSTVTLISHLKTALPPPHDIKSKLGVIHGGHHKYMVALSRVAFSEGVCIEEGIDEEVAEMAHAILDEGLSPEEGEGLLRVFGGSAG